MNKATILKVYNTFFGELQDLYRAEGVAARPYFAIDDKQSNSRKIVLKSVCAFSGCAYKPTSTERVDVLLQSSETYASAENELASSTVRLLYLWDQGKKAQSILPMHYDFDPTVKGGHPIFHAQLGVYNFTEAELSKVSYEKDIVAIDYDLYSNIRIPTACMNFASTVLGITADHFKPQTFEAVLKALRKSDLVNWNAQCKSFQESIGATGNYLPSHHWYDLAPAGKS
jgi:hypothetical protein